MPCALPDPQETFPLREVVVYSRQGCHLCELMLDRVAPACQGRASLEVRDVDTREEWLQAFGLEVPVLFVDGAEVSRYEFDAAAFEQALQEGQAR